MDNSVGCRVFAAALTAILMLGGAAAAQTLRASHQFPGGKGDVRDDMVQMIAKDVKAANVGLDIQVYPGAALFKPNDQWDALVNGQLDISLFPLDYASGKVPAFSATLMPGLIGGNERAKRINASAFMTDMRKIIADAGVIVLSDAWFAGGMAAKTGCILEPANLKGHQIPRRRPDLRGDVGSRRRQYRDAALERDLQRVPDRRGAGDRYQPRHFRLDAALRTGQMPDGAGRPRALDDVRAGADVEEEFRQADDKSSKTRSSKPARTRRPITKRKRRPSTTKRSRPSRTTTSRS